MQVIVKYTPGERRFFLFVFGATVMVKMVFLLFLFAEFLQKMVPCEDYSKMTTVQRIQKMKAGVPRCREK